MDTPSSPSPLTRLGRLFLAAVDVYALAVLVILVAHYTIGERWNVVALVNNLLHLLLLTTPLGLILALPLRRWGAAAMLLLPLGVTIFHYTPMFIPGTAQASGGVPLTLLTYNVFARYDPAELDESIAIIREANADIVLVQEVGSAAEESLMAQLDDMYPHMALHPQTWANSGQGMLSRYPITTTEYWHYDYDLSIYLGHQRATLDINGTEVVIYNAHPLHPGMVMLDVSIRGDDLDTVLERVEQEPEAAPVLLAGDMNMTPFTRDYRRIRQAGFDDAFYDAGRGFGFTFPPQLPALRLDYVFYDAQWRALDARVIPQSGGSDHFPLLVELELRTTP